MKSLLRELYKEKEKLEKIVTKAERFLTNYSKNSPSSIGGEMNCKKMKKQKKNTCSIMGIVV